MREGGRLWLSPGSLSGEGDWGRGSPPSPLAQHAQRPSCWLNGTTQFSGGCREEMTMDSHFKNLL